MRKNPKQLQNLDSKDGVDRLENEHKRRKTRQPCFSCFCTPTKVRFSLFFLVMVQYFLELWWLCYNVFMDAYGIFTIFQIFNLSKKNRSNVRMMNRI